MSAHQAARVHPRAVVTGRFVKGVHEDAAVVRVVEYRRFAIAARHDVIQRAWELESGSSGHTPRDRNRQARAEAADSRGIRLGGMGGVARCATYAWSSLLKDCDAPSRTLCRRMFLRHDSWSDPSSGARLRQPDTGE